MRFFPVLTTLLLLASVSSGQQIEERVLVLPEYSNKLYTTIVFSDPPTARDTALRELFLTHPAFQTLAQNTVVNLWDDSKSIVNSSAWSSYLGPERPALLIQAPPDDSGNAKVIFFAKGDNLPIGSNLPSLIQSALNCYAEQCRPRGPREPDPAPVPRPSPPPSVVEPIIPTIVPQEDGESGGTPLLFFLLPLAGAGLGLYQSLKQES